MGTPWDGRPPPAAAQPGAPGFHQTVRNTVGTHSTSSWCILGKQPPPRQGPTQPFTISLARLGGAGGASPQLDAPTRPPQEYLGTDSGFFLPRLLKPQHPRQRFKLCSLTQKP